MYPFEVRSHAAPSSIGPLFLFDSSHFVDRQTSTIQARERDWLPLEYASPAVFIHSNTPLLHLLPLASRSTELVSRSAGPVCQVRAGLESSTTASVRHRSTCAKDVALLRYIGGQWSGICGLGVCGQHCKEVCPESYRQLKWMAENCHTGSVTSGRLRSCSRTSLLLGPTYKGLG